MKKLNFLIWLFIFGFQGMGQIPQFINYQAIARYSNSNIPIPHQNINVNFKIRQGGATGNILFEESQTATTDDCGLFNLKIGNVQPALFKQINWSTGKKFLEVNINGAATGVSELSSTPYALYASVAGSSLDWTNVGDTILYSINKNIGIGTSSPLTPLQIKGDGNLMRLEGETHCYIELYPNGPDTRKGWIGYGSGLSATLTVNNDAGHIVLLPGGTGNVGIGTSSPQSKLDVHGDASVNTLTIKGGSDWYEEAMSEKEIEPGHVVVIDPDALPNSVKLNTCAYDKMIVGVVSGAGSINPGIGLKQSDMLEGNTKIAMGGKVKVYVTGEVKPGDLLTSSNKPGFAMAVKNRKKAFGAVLGKALSVPDNAGLALMQVMMQ